MASVIRSFVACGLSAVSVILVGSCSGEGDTDRSPGGSDATVPDARDDRETGPGHGARDTGALDAGPDVVSDSGRGDDAAGDHDAGGGGDAAEANDAGRDSGGGADGSTGPGRAIRVGGTFVINAASAAPDRPITPSRWTEIAFDPVHGVFLAAWSSLGNVYGRFMSQDGVLLGEPFAIPEPPAAGYSYPDHPRLAFNPQSGAFLAVFREERGDTPDPPPPHTLVQKGRMLSYTGGGVPAFLSPVFQISTGGDINGTDTNPAVAYSVTSREFLVAYMAAGLFAQRLNDTGEAIGDVITIAPAGEWDTEPALAWNEQTDEFLVAWEREASSPHLYSILGRRIKAGTGALPDAPVAIGDPAPEGLRTPEVQFDPVRNRYLVVWMRAAPGGAQVSGKFVRADNSPDGPEFVVSAMATYDGIGLAYNPFTDTFVSTYTQAPGGDNDRTWGVQISGDGLVGPEIELMTPEANTNYTRVAANPFRAEWLSVATIRFTTTLGQRVGVAW